MVVSYPTNTSACSGNPRSIDGHSPRKNALVPSALPEFSRIFPDIFKDVFKDVFKGNCMTEASVQYMRAAYRTDSSLECSDLSCNCAVVELVIYVTRGFLQESVGQNHFEKIIGRCTFGMVGVCVQQLFARPWGRSMYLKLIKG